MKEELAALKKKRDAGDITAFKFKKQSDKIREKYGKKGEPSNVSKIFTYISTKSPMDALRDTGVLKASPKSVKGKAAAKAAKTKAQNARSDRQLIAKARSEKAKQTPRADTPTKRAAPKFNPSGLKVSAKKKAKAAPKKEKMYTAINMKTGKADFDAPKVTAAQRLKQEDKYKVLNNIKKAAKSSMAKKGKK